MNFKTKYCFKNLIIFFACGAFCSCAKKVYKVENQFNFGNEYFEYASQNNSYVQKIDTVKFQPNTDSLKKIDSFISKQALRDYYTKNNFIDSNLYIGLNDTQKINSQLFMESTGNIYKNYKYSGIIYLLTLAFLILMALTIDFVAVNGGSVGALNDILILGSIALILASIICTIIAITESIQNNLLFKQIITDLSNRGQVNNIMSHIQYKLHFSSRRKIRRLLVNTAPFSQRLGQSNSKTLRQNYILLTSLADKRLTNIFLGRKIIGNTFYLFLFSVFFLLLLNIFFGF